MNTQHLYVVDMFRDVVQKLNEAFAGKFTDWTDKTKLPVEDGMYRLQGFGNDFVSIGGMLVKNGDIIQCRNGVSNLNNVVYYNYGHPVELVATLTELSKNELTENLRYPLIALVTDFSETKDSPDYYCKCKLNFIIINLTKPEYKAEQRTEISFKPVLHPIYEEFLNQIEKSKYFLIKYDESIPHMQVDRYYWGRNGTLDNEVWGKAAVYGAQGNIFNDYIDAIEIIGMELKVNNQFNSKNNLLK